MCHSISTHFVRCKVPEYRSNFIFRIFTHLSALNTGFMHPEAVHHSDLQEVCTILIETWNFKTIFLKKVFIFLWLCFVMSLNGLDRRASTILCPNIQVFLYNSASEPLLFIYNLFLLWMLNYLIMFFENWKLAAHID